MDIYSSYASHLAKGNFCHPYVKVGLGGDRFSSKDDEYYLDELNKC